MCYKQQTKMKAKYLFFAILFVLSLGFDQATKIWARHSLKPRGYDKALVVVPGYFDMRYSENTGSAFGMFRGTPGARYFLFGVGLLCLGVVGAWLHKIPESATWLGIKLGMLAGGAVGNIIDRMLYGRVTDFVVWKVTTGGRVYEWPTFNIADVALVVGVAMLLIDWPRDAVFKEQAQQAGA